VGLVVDWWDAYIEAHEEPESINWQEFMNSFKSHHVPQSDEAKEEREDMFTLKLTFL
jgi:hypothetical protein